MDDLVNTGAVGGQAAGSGDLSQSGGASDPTKDRGVLIGSPTGHEPRERDLAGAIQPNSAVKGRENSIAVRSRLAIAGHSDGSSRSLPDEDAGFIEARAPVAEVDIRAECELSQFIESGDIVEGGKVSARVGRRLAEADDLDDRAGAVDAEESGLVSWLGTLGDRVERHRAHDTEGRILDKEKTAVAIRRGLAFPGEHDRRSRAACSDQDGVVGGAAGGVSGKIPKPDLLGVVERGAREKQGISAIAIGHGVAGKEKDLRGGWRLGGTARGGEQCRDRGEAEGEAASE